MSTKYLPAVLSSICLLAACGTTTKLETPAVNDKQPVAQTDSHTMGTVDSRTTDPLNDPKSALAKRSVYFDYDTYTVKDEYKPVVTTHADYLSHHKDRKIVIQGNTDERGSSEYNLALGQKRAEAVRKSLMAMGVAGEQMEAISFGKEKPKATGSSETAWAENRRADIVYQQK
ncbi:MAG TPA: peptidoglycan-associated lipoprotein Pal [Noviherbaspirillum sp.]